MSVYNQISKNKNGTFFILLIFIFLFCGLFYTIGLYTNNANEYFIVGFIISFFSSVFSYYFSDRLVLLGVGAQPADKSRFFDLYTVTENLSIASGLPMPKLYVIESSAPNAFATGRNPQHATICITTGLLNKLDRYEIEGVIAHELSHVKNYDILLASIISVLVGTITLVTDWIIRNFWWSGLKKDNRKSDTNLVTFILIIIVIIITPIAATIIQLSLSRKREYLADADAVLMTRNPKGLANALQKISQDDSPLHHVNTSNAHLFITNPLKHKHLTNFITNLFSTHPPIEERIRILNSM